MARRRQRIDIEGGIHHVMNRGVDRRPVFFGDADRVEFGRLLAELHERFAVQTLAYCLVPNHFHLLLRCGAGGLPAAMQHLSSVYTRHTNDRVGRDGPLFWGRYHAIHVDTDSYLKWAVRYIHRNALDVTGVRQWDQYRWSSARAYLGLRRVPPFLDTGFVLEFFDGDFGRLAAFTSDDQTVDPKALHSCIELAIAADRLSHEADDGYGVQQMERTVRLLLLDAIDDPTTRAWLEQGVDLPTGAARRMALSRARRRLGADPSVRHVLDLVIADIRPPRRVA